jgi:hypothetical protein
MNKKIASIRISNQNGGDASTFRMTIPEPMAQ